MSQKSTANDGSNAGPAIASSANSHWHSIVDVVGVSGVMRWVIT